MSKQAKWQEQVQKYGPAIVVAVLVVVGWETAVRLLGINQFLLPKPSAILRALYTEWGSISPRISTTTRSALGGFVIGSGLGLIVAFITARFAALQEAMMPFAIAANSVPIIAMSPIMFNWFGPTNPLSWMMIVAVVVFFPVMINVTRGLTEVPPAALELMRSYAASDWQILTKLRIPNAVPFLFTALRTASVLSMISAIVADFFGAERITLGKYVTQEAAVLRFENTWAAIFVVSLLGILFYGAIVLLERWVVPYQANE